MTGGEKAKSDALVQGGTQAWAQRVPTNERLRTLKGPRAQQFPWVCSSLGRGAIPPGELVPREAPSPDVGGKCSWWCLGTLGADAREKERWFLLPPRGHSATGVQAQSPAVQAAQGKLLRGLSQGKGGCSGCKGISSDAGGCGDRVGSYVGLSWIAALQLVRPQASLLSSLLSPQCL